MRKGKEFSQISHASNVPLCRLIQDYRNYKSPIRTALLRAGYLFIPLAAVIFIQLWDFQYITPFVAAFFLYVGLVDCLLERLPAIPEPLELWIDGSFAKVVLQAKDEHELLTVYDLADDAGLPVYLITDSGRTEFHGVPTNTAISIGPYYADDIDKITGNSGVYPLKLY